MPDERPGRIDVKRAISQGWSDMLEGFPLWLGLGILALGATAVSLVTVIGLFLLVPVLGWGVMAALIAIHDRRGELGLLFSGFADYGRVLGTMWGLFLLGLAVALPGQAASLAGEYTRDPRMAALGGLLDLAWNLAMLPFSFAPYFAVDRRIGALEAFRASWRYTHGQWVSLLLLTLAGCAIALLGLLAFAVGVIPASAVIAFMWISAYRQLLGARPEEGTRPPVAEPAATSFGPS